MLKSKNLGVIAFVLFSSIASGNEFDVNTNYFFEDRYDSSQYYEVEDMVASKTKQIWPGINAETVASKTKQIWPGINAETVASKTKQIWPGINAETVASKTKQIWPGIEQAKENINKKFSSLTSTEKAAILSLTLVDLGISVKDLEELNPELAH